MLLAITQVEKYPPPSPDYTKILRWLKWKKGDLKQLQTGLLNEKLEVSQQMFEAYVRQAHLCEDVWELYWNQR